MRSYGPHLECDHLTGVGHGTIHLLNEKVNYLILPPCRDPPLSRPADIDVRTMRGRYRELISAGFMCV